MKKLIPIMIIIFFGSVSFAQNHPGMGRKHQGKKACSMECPGMKGKMGGMDMHCGCMGLMMCNNDMMLENLGLSEPNRAAIKETVEKMRKDMMDMHNRLRDAQKALNDEYSKKDINEGTIGELNRKIVELHSAKMEMMLNARKSIMMRLTPEQRAKFSCSMNCKMNRKRMGK